MQQSDWLRELLRIFLIVAITTAIGVLFEQPLWGAVIGLAVSQLIMLKRSSDLFRWSNKQASDELIRRERQLTKKIRRQKKQIKRIAAAIEALQDGVLIIDNSGHVNILNRAACHLLGLKADTDIGQHITNVLRDPSFIQFFDDADYSDVIEFESPHTIDLIVQIQITQFGRNQKVLIVRDVTERQRVEQMRKNFIANVSHELRTPLTVIYGYLEMLSDVDMNPAVTQAVGQMSEQTERMKSLVNDLLHLSKLESNNLDKEGEWFELNSLCALSIEQLKTYTATSLTGEQLPEANITCDCIADIEMLGYSDEISSVLSNLITNAIKYGCKEGQMAQVSISITSTAQGVEMAVSDQGNGIAENHLAHLTERFYRVDESRESTIGGSGLGLAIVRHALEHHGALLKIESVLGHGSRFSFIIPMQRIRHTQD